MWGVQTCSRDNNFGWKEVVVVAVRFGPKVGGLLPTFQLLVSGQLHLLFGELVLLYYIICVEITQTHTNQYICFDDTLICIFFGVLRLLPLLGAEAPDQV